MIQVGDPVRVKAPDDDTAISEGWRGSIGWMGTVHEIGRNGPDSYTVTFGEGAKDGFWTYPACGLERVEPEAPRVKTEPIHIAKTRELRDQMIRAADDADTQLRRLLVCATALAHPIESMEPIRQAIWWLAQHARYTEDSRETEEIIEGVLP